MSKPALLKEYIRLVLETTPASPQEPFVLKGPIKKAGPNRWSRSGEYSISREFPVIMDEQLQVAMGITPDELEDGAVNGEHEVVIEADVHFSRSRFRGSRYEPPDPDEWELQEWSVVALDGFEVGPEDAAALKAYLGDLTDDEIDRIRESWFDNGGDEPPDPPDRDDYDY